MISDKAMFAYTDVQHRLEFSAAEETKEDTKNENLINAIKVHLYNETKQTARKCRL